MKGFRFLAVAVAVCTLLLTNCGPGKGTNGRTGDYDRHNELVDDSVRHHRN